MISSLPSLSTSAMDNWWSPWSVHFDPLVDELLSNVHFRVRAPLRKSQAVMVLRV
jgi:hypothetical protein